MSTLLCVCVCLRELSFLLFMLFDWGCSERAEAKSVCVSRKKKLKKTASLFISSAPSADFRKNYDAKLFSIIYTSLQLLISFRLIFSKILFHFCKLNLRNASRGTADKTTYVIQTSENHPNLTSAFALSHCSRLEIKRKKFVTYLLFYTCLFRCLLFWTGFNLFFLSWLFERVSK